MSLHIHPSPTPAHSLPHAIAGAERSSLARRGLPATPAASVALTRPRNPDPNCPAIRRWFTDTSAALQTKILANDGCATWEGATKESSERRAAMAMEPQAPGAATSTSTPASTSTGDLALLVGPSLRAVALAPLRVCFCCAVEASGHAGGPRTHYCTHYCTVVWPCSPSCGVARLCAVGVGSTARTNGQRNKLR